MAQYVVKQLEQLHEHDQNQDGDPIRIAMFSFWIFHARLKRRAFPKLGVFGKNKNLAARPGFHEVQKQTDL
jgi:hypothetical protein